MKIRGLPDRDESEQRGRGGEIKEKRQRRSVLLHINKVLHLCLIYWDIQRSRQQVTNLSALPAYIKICNLMCLHVHMHLSPVSKQNQLTEKVKKRMQCTAVQCCSAERALAAFLLTASSFHQSEDSVCSSWANNTGFSPEGQALMSGLTLSPWGPLQWSLVQHFLCQKDALSINMQMH